MSRIQGKDTKPEMVVRKLVFAMGYRYRLHGKNLPGKPDLVFPGRRKVIFVHGCFWHRHRCKYGRPTPQNRKAFWAEKFKSTVVRDRKNIHELKKLGWDVLVVWECQTRNTAGVAKLAIRIRAFLDDIPIGVSRPN